MESKLVIKTEYAETRPHISRVLKVEGGYKVVQLFPIPEGFKCANVINARGDDTEEDFHIFYHTPCALALVHPENHEEYGENLMVPIIFDQDHQEFLPVCDDLINLEDEYWVYGNFYEGQLEKYIVEKYSRDDLCLACKNRGKEHSCDPSNVVTDNCGAVVECSDWESKEEENNE